jgi:hypothetical protein
LRRCATLLRAWGSVFGVRYLVLAIPHLPMFTPFHAPHTPCHPTFTPGVSPVSPHSQAMPPQIRPISCLDKLGFPDHPMSRSPDLFAALCRCLSATNPTRLLRFYCKQTTCSIRPSDDRAVEAISRLLLSAFIRASLLRLPSFAWISVKHFALCDPLPTTLSRLPPPEGKAFAANKSSTAIQQPYDCLVEALFPAAFAVDLAEC